MHELPPLRHSERGTVIDLHHAITPLTSRVRVDTRLLLRETVAVPGMVFHTLSPRDIVLHCVCHLMCEGEFPHGLRDLFDIYELLEHFGEASSSRAAFWSDLAERADQLGLGRLLAHAASMLTNRFHLVVPPESRRWIVTRLPPPPARGLVGWLLERGIVGGPGPALTDSLVAWMLLARSHYLRMPLRLLVPHFAWKGWNRLAQVGRGGVSEP